MAPTSGDRDRDRGRDRDRHRDRDRGRDWDRERDGSRGPSDMHYFGSSKDNEHEFNFQADKRLPQDRNRGGDSYRPGDRYSDDRGGKGGGTGGDRDRREWGRDRHRDRDRDDRRGRDHRDRGRNGGPSWGGRPGGFGGGEWKPKIPVPAHSRPMMLYKREKTPEQLEGMVSSGVYSEIVNAEEAADVDEEGSVQMELDEDGDNVGAGGGGVVAEAGVLVETGEVIPTEDITEGEEAVKAEQMKMDVIAMIRKAKGKPTVAAPVRNEVAANDDFISFGFSDDEKEKEKHVTEDRGLDEDHGRKSRRGNDGKRVDPLPPLPPSPSASRDKVFSNQDKFGQPLDEVPPPPPPPPHLLGMDIGPPGASGTLISSNLPPPPGLSTLPIGPKAPETNSSAVQGGIVFSLPAKPPPPAPAPITPNLSTWPPPAHIVTDVISISSSPTPPPQFAGKKRKHDETNFATHITPAGLAPEYMIPRNAQKNPTPWLLHDHSRTLHPSDMLHKEIHDFMMYIRPRRYEHALRRHVIHRVRKAITNSLYDVDVRVFGSFPAEIYLPTSDIDLAVISRDFARSGMPKYNTKNTLFRVSNLLRKAKIPKDDKVAVIHTAKVPIIKFVDRLSGLQIDICFENLSGVTANRTYKRWREEYPAMPALAMIIKHFLELRKQNEVYAGGLGGFTVVCLVISLFQLHPGFSTGNIPIEKNLGVGLMEFLDLYGHRFDLSKVGIDVATASYFRKPYLPPPRFGVDTKSREYKDYWLLHITDPNDPDNNVSKSSYGVKDIFRTFADGFKALEDRMRTVHYGEFGERKGGVLGAILGGNYDAIEKQRATMRRLYQEVFKEKAVEDEYYGELDGVEDDDGLWRWEWEEAEQPPQGEGEGGEGWVVDVKGVGVGGGTLTGKQNDREKKGEREAEENDHKNEKQPEHSSTGASSKAKSPKRKGTFPVGNPNDVGGRGGGGGKKSRNFQKKHKNKA